MFKNLQKSGWAILAIWFNLLALSAWSNTPDNNYMVRRSITADPITITGKVTSPGEGNIGLPGVSVYLKGTTTGTITDSEGNYTINLPDGSGTLVFSFIGYTLKEEVINGRTSINVGLKQDIQTLDEVVVVGYGTVSKRDLTTSVSSISARQIKDIPINSAGQAIAGRLAGVQVTTAEGTPNADVTIRVRGGGSITQDNSPIYVVDGVQVENALSVIAPQDIASIDVLKDASATAIYGARGANGVVIITTKGGKKMKPVISYSGMFGVRKLANKLDVMNSYDFVKYQYEASRGSTAASNSFLKTYGAYDDLELYKQVPTTDWQEEMFGRNALMQTHNISVTGGTAATQYNVSLSSNTEQGIMRLSDFDRKLATVKIDQKIIKSVKVGVSGRYNYTVVNGAGTSNTGSSSVNSLRQSVKYKPILFPGQTIEYYDQDYADQTNANSLSLVNPILLNKATYQKDITSVGNVSAYVSVDITKFLTFKSTLGYDMTDKRINNFYDSITNVSQQQGKSKPYVTIQKKPRQIINNSNVLSFSLNNLNPDLAKYGKLDALIGHEIYQTIDKIRFNAYDSFPSGIENETAIKNTSIGFPLNNTYQEYHSRILSFFGRVNYSYKDRYLVALTMRGDGSSKFAKGKRWGYFPSASLAWKVLNEGFMKDFSTGALNDFKIRASYGQSGNNRIDDFLYLSQFDSIGVFYSLNNNLIRGFQPPELANNNLKWETTTSRNLGLDAAFLNNRVQISVDFYKNTTKDLLLDVQVPTNSGYGTQIQNVGATSSQGFELQLSGTPIQTKDFNWNANFNISFQQNKVVSLAPGQSFYPVSSGWAGGNAPKDYAALVGRSVGVVWGFETDGFYKVDDFDYNNGVYKLKEGVADAVSILGPVQPGFLKLKDLNNDGGIDLVNDRKAIGNTTPKFFGGLNQQLSYKNFDASIFINFQYGNDVLNLNKLEFTSGYTTNANMLSIMNDRWRNVDESGKVIKDPEELKALNANAKIWSPSTTNSYYNVHSWAVEDGSFIRINNVTIGYTIPTTLLSKVRIKQFRIYATANNLAVFTNYSGYDPDVNSRRASPLTPGADYSAYPKSRAYIFGVNLSF